MIQNDTLHDILATAAIVPVYAIFLVAPGFCLGWATNLLRFRSRTAAEKLLLSLPFSVVLSTVLANIVGQFLPATVILWIFIALAAVASIRGFAVWTGSWIRTRQLPRLRMRLRTKIAVLLALVWTVVVIASLVDIQIGQRLYPSSALWDHSVRIAFLNSALRSGPPPRNPFFFVGSAPDARYYYYWYVLCSYPARLTHIGARYVLYGSSVWAGFALAALIPIYLADFFEITKNLERKSLLGILLLAVTGLDILPTIYEYLRAGIIPADMEWWDPTQVTAWEDALLWVPHHVVALVACFIGFLSLWSVRSVEGRPASGLGSRTVAVVFAAMAFAAAAGLSVYVTFTFAVFLFFWALWLLFRHAFRDFFSYGVAACIAIVISVPYLHDLLQASGAVGTAAGAKATAAGGFISLAMRAMPSFILAPYFLKVRGFYHPLLLLPVGLIVVYILEFGFFAFVGWERWRSDRRRKNALDDAEAASWFLVVIGMFVITFLRSSVIANNDLAYRSAMIVQFVLLLWGACYLDDRLSTEQWNRTNWMRPRNLVIAATLTLGFLGTLASLAILRTYTVLDDKGMLAHSAVWLPPASNVGTGIFEIRQAYERLDRVLPATAITQYNPMTPDYLPLLQYDKFQSVDGVPDCGSAFGGDLAKCLPAQRQIADLFNDPGPHNIHDLCQRLSMDVLVARKTDPAWRDPTSWVWTNHPIVANGYIRAFRCR